MGATVIWRTEKVLRACEERGWIGSILWRVSENCIKEWPVHLSSEWARCADFCILLSPGVSGVEVKTGLLSPWVVTWTRDVQGGGQTCLDTSLFPEPYWTLMTPKTFGSPTLENGHVWFSQVGCTHLLFWTCLSSSQYPIQCLADNTCLIRICWLNFFLKELFIGM